MYIYFELLMKDQIEERSSQLARNLSTYEKKGWTELSTELSSQLGAGHIVSSQYDQLPDGLIAQLEEHCTGVAEVMGSVESRPRLKFFRLSFRNFSSCALTARIFLLFESCICFCCFSKMLNWPLQNFPNLSFVRVSLPIFLCIFLSCFAFRVSRDCQGHQECQDAKEQR